MKNKLPHFKSRKTFILAICILCLVGYSTLNIGYLYHFERITNSADLISKNESREHIPLTSDYTLVDPINISSPSDWATYGFITGDGSNINPYVIEDVEIQGNGVETMEVGTRTYLNYTYCGIYINSNGSFIIRNCKISSISIGILLDYDISPEHNHTIENVEIDNCGVGIYNYWFHFRVNISKCKISNCNWVTVKIPDVFDIPIFYGGFGIWVKGDSGSIIESCRIQNCSIGLFAGATVDIVSNQLVNCGFLFDIQYMYVYDAIINNTVNGKPLGLFLATEDLVITAQEAALYGQLIFQGCPNLYLSNLQINIACSFGLMIISCSNSVLENIVCENQKIGFLIITDFISASNLHAKMCDAGFLLIRARHSTFNRLLTDNTDVPVYIREPISDTMIQIEKTTWFYIIDSYNLNKIQINSSVSSVNVSVVNLTQFELVGFAIQLNHTGIYQVIDLDPNLIYINLTVVIFDRSASNAIPGFPLIWFFPAILLGILFLNFSKRYERR